MTAHILVGFGDSWTNGDELDRSQEKTYIELLGKQFGIHVLNYAVSSSSIGHMLIQFQQFIVEKYHPANKYHAVFFLTAKERGFYYDDADHTIKHMSPNSTAKSFQEDGYYKYYCEQTGDLNANRDIIGLQALCKAYGITDYWMLGWQRLPLWNIIDKGRFFAGGELPITTLFTQNNRVECIFDLVNPLNKNPYIWPNLGHPNQLGHQTIADAIAKIIKL